jgi:hypothetical protein
VPDTGTMVITVPVSSSPAPLQSHRHRPYHAISIDASCSCHGSVFLYLPGPLLPLVDNADDGNGPRPQHPLGLVVEGPDLSLPWV